MLENARFTQAASRPHPLYLAYLEAIAAAQDARKAAQDARRQLEAATLAQAARLLGDRP